MRDPATTISGSCAWRIFAMPIEMVASQTLLSLAEFLLGGIAAITRALGTSSFNARMAGDISASAETMTSASKRPFTPSLIREDPSATSLSFSS
jgi:hypothetical protein